ncbi:MAG: TolC family protein [Bacteroidota bacterium]
MKIINYLLCFSYLLVSLTSRAQQKEEYTLEQLQTLAKENYPLLKQKQMYTDIGNNKARQIGTNFLPQVNVTGQATYQSEVTEFAFPGITSSFQQKPDQYALGLEVKENLLDYGAIKTQKRIERENAEMQSQQVDAEFLKLKDRINQLYGNVCLQQENKKIMRLRMNELEAKRQKMQSAVSNGAALPASFLVLESEYLSTQQKLEEINSNLNSWYKTISIITNKTIDTNAVFTDAKKEIALQATNIRPEYRLYELQSNSLKLKESMITKNNLPKLFVFGRGYYGRPGYNFLNNEFRPYGLVGAGLSWNLTAYYTSGKDKKNLKINNDIVSNQKKIFDLNIQSTLLQQQEEIMKLERMIVMDFKIVDAKTSIRKASSSQLDNGVITSSDYIVDLNAENQAQFNLKLHEIQLLMAKQNYNTTLGY